MTEDKKQELVYVEEALKEAEIEARSPVAIRRRNACDKAFLAVVKAIDQLLVKHGYREPGRHGERFGYLRERARTYWLAINSYKKLLNTRKLLQKKKN